MSKETIVLLSRKIRVSNPLFRMYQNSLRDSYDILISSLDGRNLSDGLASYRSIWSYISFLFKWFPVGGESRKRGVVFWALYPLGIISFIAIYIFENFTHSFRVFLYCKRKRLVVCSVVAVDGDYLLAARLCSCIFRVKNIYFVYEVWPDQLVSANFMDDSARIARALIERWSVRAVSKIITVSGAWSKIIRRRYGVPLDRFVEIPVCPNRYDGVLASSIRVPMRFHYHGAIFLSRGLEELIRAFRGIDGAVLYLRGQGSGREALSELILAEGLSDRVFILPPVAVEDLVAQGVDYDVGIIMARPDTVNGRMCTGFKYFEYMNSGLAILAPSSYPLRELLGQHKCGRNYGWPSVDSLRSAINWFIGNPGAVYEMKQEAVFFASKYNMSFQGERLINEVFHGSRD